MQRSRSRTVSVPTLRTSICLSQHNSVIVFLSTMKKYIWRVTEIFFILSIFQTAKSDSDPFDYIDNQQFDDYEHAPGEPLTPTDFENAEKIRLTSPMQGHGKDPIEIAGLYEGDIIITPNERRNKNSKNAINNEEQKWKKGIVPYLISSEFDDGERSVIARAMMEFHRQTCIVFTPRKLERDYAHIIKGQGCSSLVGRVGGVQEVRLGKGCIYPGIAIHELMHVVGFWHEQSRWDRDEHVKVYFENIQTGMEYNFKKFNWDQTQNLSAPYDVGSIMHYGAYAFAKDRNRPTILPHNPNDRIGQRQNFSSIDVLKINRLYKCKSGGNSGSNSTGPSPSPRPSRRPATQRPPQSVGKCVDSHKHCKRWSEMGECNRNPTWMHVNCRLSCNQCENMCADNNANCKYWADRSECNKNPEYMHTYCAKSCQKCDLSSDPSSSCEDKDKNCANWAARGECERNPRYMKANCRKSCKTCSSSHHVASTGEDSSNSNEIATDYVYRLA